jgi:multiple sugar transport system substrate-binding protein
MISSNTARRATVLATAAALALGAGACGSNEGGDAGGESVTLQYWLWDDAQLPGYQQCADDFTAATPEVKVEITQTAWAQYWANLATQVAAGSAPDVWVDQLSYYPQFVADKQIEDLQPYIDKEPDGVDLDQYVGGLTDLWAVDGARYGLPKDWDTIGLIVNRAAAEEAGLDEAALGALTWNPDDGGTFEQAIAKLTVDKAGKHGDDPAFDPGSVAVYGFLTEWADGSQGQNLWGNLAFSNGFTYADKNPFGTKFNYDSPALAATIDWMASLAGKGYAPPLDLQSTLSRLDVLADGGGSATSIGSFNQMLYKDSPDDWIFAPLPTGPDGRKSAINGLSDAMYAGGKHKDQAWAWIKYLASPACQDVIGETGVVFPAVREASEKSAATRAAAGLDTSAFFSYLDEPDGTFIVPVSNHGTEIAQIIQDAIQSVGLGSADAATALKAANDKVNALF